MKSASILIAALASTTLFAASAAAQMAPPVIVDDAVAALRDDANANDTYAWDLTEGLTTEIGPRLAGTEAEKRARDWSVRKLKAMGFSNVRIEEFPLTVWTRGHEAAEILSPFPQPLAVTALGYSGSSGPKGVTGEVIGFGSVDELRAADPASVKGKIVFIDHRMAPTQDGSSYGPGGMPRRAGPTIASLMGAKALVVRSAGTDEHRNPHTGATGWQGGATPIPAGALAIPDAQQLERILKRGRPVTMKLTLVNESHEGTSGNVIAEVPGRNPALEPVMVACHLDSWDLGTGAFDDGAGCGIVAAAAKRIMDAGKPERTIKVVFFGAEETGLWGANAYQNRHADEKLYAVAESDFGADRVWRVTSNLGEARIDEARMLGAAMAPLGIVTGPFDEAEGSDISVLLNAGQPGVGLSQDGIRYFDYHHTPDDTLDKVDPVQLRQNVAAYVTMLAVLAGPVK